MISLPGTMKNAAAWLMSALLCAMMAAPATAFAAESAQVTSRSETVKATLSADGNVEKTDVETILKYANGESETVEDEATGDLPIAVKVSYRLNGQAVSPDDLAGKSGDVSIRYDYRNLTGADGAPSVPFTCITALMVDDSFSNVEVDNGKMIEDEDQTIIAGFAFPGLKESLGDAVADADIPEYFEVRAQVEDFELKTAMTIATAGLFADIDDEDLSLGELEDVPDALSEAMGQLIAGADALDEGLDQLAGASDALHEGASSLNYGTSAFSQATSDAASAATEVSGGASELSNGLKALSYGDGTAQNPGLSGMSGSLSELSDSLSSYQTQSASGQSLPNHGGEFAELRSTLQKVASETDDPDARSDAQIALSQLDQLEAAVNADAQALSTQTGEEETLKQVANALATLSTALAAQASGLKQATESSSMLADGTAQLAQGLKELGNQSQVLAYGAYSLDSGSSQMAEGAHAVASGSTQLAAGLRAFDEEGIGSINDVIKNRYGALLDRMRELSHAAKDYKSFTGDESVSDSSVKFILESAPITDEA